MSHFGMPAAAMTIDAALRIAKSKEPSTTAFIIPGVSCGCVYSHWCRSIVAGVERMGDEVLYVCFTVERSLYTSYNTIGRHICDDQGSKAGARAVPRTIACLLTVLQPV